MSSYVSFNLNGSDTESDPYLAVGEENSTHSISMPPDINNTKLQQIYTKVSEERVKQVKPPPTNLSHKTVPLTHSMTTFEEDDCYMENSCCSLVGMCCSIFYLIFNE